MRHRVVVKLLLLLHCSYLTNAGFSARIPKDPRKGVLSALFGNSVAGASIVQQSVSERKEALLRKKIAQKRSMVGQTRREIEALSTRSALQSIDPLERTAHSARIAVLKRETLVMESQITALRSTLGKVTGYEGGASRPGLMGAMARGYENFVASEERSARVMFDQMQRKGDGWELLREDAGSLLRLGSNLSLAAGYLNLRGSTNLLPHAAAIISRANKLEKMAPGILEAVSEQEALPLVEPHLDTILERLDDIEPFMPFVLANLEKLAPYTGAILDHFDSLVLYGDEGGKYLETLLPYLPIFAPLFDPLGPHLALLRPHLPKVLPHLDVIAPYAGRFAPYVAVSANADVMVWYFGWALRIKYLGRFVMSLPFLPRLAAFLVHRLPRRPVRGRTWDLVCDYDECDLTRYEAKLSARRQLYLESVSEGGGGQDGKWRLRFRW